MNDRIATSDHPYKTLPANRFWKSMVGDTGGGGVRDLWVPKFPMTTAHRVITVGSCFAQHISRHLIEAGFSWLDSEPAPADLPVEQRREQGYGVFSFRTGNIYTPALLEQWINLALGKQVVGDEVFYDGNRYFDPLRPNIPPDGFASKEEMWLARAHTCASIRAVLRQVDIFVFTLGLTEAWQHRDGYVYPVCPGTIQGHFLPGTHRFHNYTYDESVAALTRTFAAIRALNPKVRFLLTVSPVPLTATASGNHILTATTYSKSVLRAAAGFLADTQADVDYFPSYELIAAPPFKGQFYAANLRSVTEAGVLFVMDHFMAAIGARPASPDAQISVVVAHDPPRPAQPLPADDEICEDIILEQWSKKEVAESAGETTLLLVGDSHMGMLGAEVAKWGMAYAGGAIMNATEWHTLNFVPDPASLFIPFRVDARQRWFDTLLLANPVCQEPNRKKLKIINNIGSHSHLFRDNFMNFLEKKYGHTRVRISFMDIKQYLLSERSVHLTLVRSLVAMGHQVIWVSDPPAQKREIPLYAAFDTMLCEYVQTTGATVFNARQWVADHGGWSALFDSGDGFHGSAEYYRTIFQAIRDDFLLG
ncbi:MAG: GSCFA domain-containing protein [Magnetococcales bacterium]|nr:GSCFA domain-containing protein [Magnetococcales bacterium]